MTKPLEGLHAIAYARVSTDDHGQDTNIQLNLIREWATTNGVIIDEEVTEDVSGAVWPRRGLSYAIMCLNSSDASILVCYDQSRLTRDADKHLTPITNALAKGKTIRYVVNGDADPSSLGVRMLSAIKGVTDDEERLVLKTKTSKAMIERRDLYHKHMGHPARLVITDNLDAENFNAGYINTDNPDKAIRTKIMKPSEVLAFARCGYTMRKVAVRVLDIDPAVFLRAVKSYDERHGENLHKTYYEILNATKGVN